MGDRFGIRADLKMWHEALPSCSGRITAKSRRRSVVPHMTTRSLHDGGASWHI